MNQLAKKIVKKLIYTKRTISICESCTGGLLSFTLTKSPGASQTYSFGLTTYSNNSKNKLLKVSNNLLNKYGAVSKPVCLSMVNNLNKIASKFDWEIIANHYDNIMNETYQSFTKKKALN